MELHHIGWAVRRLDEHRHHFADELGLPFDGVEEFPDLRVVFYDAGTCLVELLESTSPNSDIAAFLAERGEGIHHLAYRVEDVAAALDTAETRGLRRLDAVPRPGARGTLIGFVDPAREDGVLVEYVEEG